MRLSSRCHAVLGLGYIPPWVVNAGFVVGDEVTLILDTGANALAASTIHGYAASVRPSNRMMVVNLEKHFDHIGGNSFFRDLDVDIYAHTDLDRTEEEFISEMAVYNRAIPDPERRAAGEEAAFYAGTRFANPNKSIRDDTGFELGNCPVDILLTPGHTDTNISVYVPSEKILYCADTLVNVYTPNIKGWNGEPAWRQWLASLNRIERLAPSTIVPGHGPVLLREEVPRAIEATRQLLTSKIAEKA